jgi:hypothetical protein
MRQAKHRNNRVPRNKRSARPIRRGLGILELTVAGILVGLLATAVLQLLVLMTNQHRSLYKRHVAIQESANVMERVSGISWDNLTSENLAQLAVSQEAQESLPDVALAIEVSEAEDDAKRVTVVIRWPDRPSRPDHTVRLVAWRYRR